MAQRSDFEKEIKLLVGLTTEVIATMAGLTAEVTELRKENKALREDIDMLTCVVGNTDGRHTTEFIKDNKPLELEEILKKGLTLFEDYRTRSVKNGVKNGVKNYTLLPAKFWLTFAAEREHWDCVKVLANHLLLFCNLKRGNHDAEPLANLRKDAAGALTIAVQKGLEEPVKLLTQINYVTWYISEPVLHVAIENNNFDIFELLDTAINRDKGIGINILSSVSNTRKMSAIEYAISLPEHNRFVKKLTTHYPGEDMPIILRRISTAQLFNVLYEDIGVIIPTDFTDEQRKNMLQHLLTLEGEQRNEALMLANDPTTPLGYFFAGDLASRKIIANELCKSILVDVTIEMPIVPASQQNERSTWWWGWGSVTNMFRLNGGSSSPDENEPFLDEGTSALKLLKNGTT